MLRTFGIAIFGITLLFANGPNAQTAKQKNQTDNIPTAPVTILDNSERQNDQNCPYEKTPDTHTGIEWGDAASWALVLVGGLTGWAVWKQARASAKATEATQRSVEI